MEKLERLEAFVKKHIDTMLFVLGGVATLLVLGVNFYALDKNLMPSDEAWFLTLMRDKPIYGIPTHFYLLFGDLFSENIYANRLFCWALQILGSIIFSIGIGEFIYPYVNHKRGKLYIYIISFFSVYIGQMYIILRPSLNYMILNRVVSEIGIAFLLLGVSKRKGIFFLLSGFFISFLFPIMITNTIIIPLMLLVILGISPNKLRDSFFFVSGIFLFAVYYFVCIEHPEEILSCFTVEIDNAIDKGSEDYGVLFLIKWLKNVPMFLLKCIIQAGLLICVYCFINKYCILNRYLRAVIVTIFSAIVLLYTWRYIQPLYPFDDHIHFFWLCSLFYVFVCVFLISDIMMGSITSRKIIVGCFLCAVPICLSFGSNRQFFFRGILHYMYVSSVLILFLGHKNFIRKFIVSLLIIIQCGVFLYSCTMTNWFGEKLLLQEKLPVNVIGITQNVKLNRSYLSVLDSCRKYVPLGKVLTSSERWITVCLLGYEPICYDFDVTRRSSTSFQRLIDDSVKKYDCVWVISGMKNSDSLLLNEMIEGLEGYSINKTIAGDNCYYLIKKEL